ncbi:uncharacterized protein LOC121382171 [Gigantopelta aegis]|uniref:uncharacterized protein LOC121382171 n=1 Tax=Gigantopelta aegis TaxID=1735272 RepID=UPI001B887BAC|nr:uncharacterized protein LOC121382171 [Gigantopelta aegis]
MDAEEPWSLKAGKLTARHSQLSKTNIEDVNFLFTQPKHEAFQPLPTRPTEGDYCFHHVTMRDGRGICFTVRRRGIYNLGLLLPEMDNPTLHRMIKITAGGRLPLNSQGVSSIPIPVGHPAFRRCQLHRNSMTCSPLPTSFTSLYQVI